MGSSVVQGSGVGGGDIAPQDPSHPKGQAEVSVESPAALVHGSCEEVCEMLSGMGVHELLQVSSHIRSLVDPNYVAGPPIIDATFECDAVVHGSCDEIFELLSGMGGHELLQVSSHIRSLVDPDHAAGPPSIDATLETVFSFIFVSFV